MHVHKFKFLRQSMILFERKTVVIEVWQCIKCKKLQIINKDDYRIISLNGKMGEEI